MPRLCLYRFRLRGKQHPTSNRPAHPSPILHCSQPVDKSETKRLQSSWYQTAPTWACPSDELTNLVNPRRGKILANEAQHDGFDEEYEEEHICQAAEKKHSQCRYDESIQTQHLNHPSATRYTTILPLLHLSCASQTPRITPRMLQMPLKPASKKTKAWFDLIQRWARRGMPFPRRVQTD